MSARTRVAAARAAADRLDARILRRSPSTQAQQDQAIRDSPSAWVTSWARVVGLAVLLGVLGGLGLLGSGSSGQQPGGVIGPVAGLVAGDGVGALMLGLNRRAGVVHRPRWRLRRRR